MAKAQFIASKEIGHFETWENRADKSIAHGALTNSKRPACLVKGIYPTHLEKGRGSFVWDTAGKKYIDFICGLGSNLLGYGNTDIAIAMGERAQNGASLSLGSTLEVQCAEKVKEVFPFVDLLRFLKTGSDACNAAIRIARAFRKKGKTLSEGYHGWGDEFVALTPPAHGVYVESPIEKFTEIDQIDYDTGCVIIEPVMLDASPERIQWLRQVRERCNRTGAVLIFDEVITGFRHPKLSAALHYGVIPDLVCFGKAMGNGMPIAVVGGKREIMNCEEYFVSSTFAGETLSLAAALKTMTLLQTKYDVQHIWEKGNLFLKEFNSLWPEKLKIKGYPTRGYFEGEEITKAIFWQEACRAGILFGPSWFFNFGHIDLTDQVLNTCSDIITRIKTGSVKLEGELPVTPFAAKVRSQ